jgi:hypothetical protein
MSKRTRGSRSNRARPGYRPPAQRPASKTPAPARPADAALDLDLTESAAEAVAEPVAPRAARASRGSATAGATRGAGLLAARASTEYAYVNQDLRRIGRFAAAILGVMVVLWLVIDVAGVVKL